MKECNTCENNKFSLPTMVCNDCGTGFKHYIPITDEAESEVRVKRTKIKEKQNGRYI